MAPDPENLVLVIGAVHAIGLGLAAALLFMVMRSDAERTWPAPPRGEEEDDGGGGGPRRPEPPPDPRGGGLPFPDAAPARVRLRDHRRLADLLPGFPRRSSREPERAPEHEPAGH
jgi:hypothetical protein